MTRRKLLFILPLLPAACARPAQDPLPEAVDGVWRRAASEVETNIPEVIRGLGCKQARRTTYEGPRQITVSVFEMTTSAGAFEVLQKWRVERRAVPFQKDRYFVLVTGANDLVLANFAGSLDKAMRTGE
jgi:hypothetical protein